MLEQHASLRVTVFFIFFKKKPTLQNVLGSQKRNQTLYLDPLNIKTQ